MEILGTVVCEHKVENAAILHTEIGAHRFVDLSDRRHDARSDDADRPPPGRRQFSNPREWGKMPAGKNGGLDVRRLAHHRSVAAGASARGRRKNPATRVPRPANSGAMEARGAARP